jgi:uncharacterized membrane protein YbhN (UPF0104 family)
MRWRRVIMLIVALAAIIFAVRVLLNGSGELLTAIDTLTSVSMEWVVVAILAEALSYIMWGAALAVVLRRGGGKIGPFTLAAVVLAGDAAAYCLPFGFATSGVVVFDVLRRRRIGAAVAAWTFAVCTVFDIGALTVLTITAVEILGNNRPRGLQALSIGLLVALTLLCVGYAVLHQPAIRHQIAQPLKGARWAVSLRGTSAALGSHQFRRILQRLRAPIVNVCRHLAWQLRTIRLTPATGVTTFTLMMLCRCASVDPL